MPQHKAEDADLTDASWSGGIPQTLNAEDAGDAEERVANQKEFDVKNDNSTHGRGA